jgi:cytochrome c556
MSEPTSRFVPVGSGFSRIRSRRVALTAAAVLAGVVGVAGVALAQKNPYRTYNEEKFVQNMQTAGRNYAAVADLLARKDYESAKAQLTRVREQLAITVQFWRDKKKDDALTMLRETLERTDDLDNALSQEAVNPEAVAAASQRLGASCQACHAQYRVHDPATKTYRIKPGSIQ